LRSLFISKGANRFNYYLCLEGDAAGGLCLSLNIAKETKVFRSPRIALLLTLFLGHYAHAHGNLLQQAQGVTSTCLDYMYTTEPKNLVRYFKSVHSEIAGNEIFTVTISLRNGMVLNYQATGVDGVDENGQETFSWKCEKLTPTRTM
jgi:hypothetical protein